MSAKIKRIGILVLAILIGTGFPAFRSDRFAYAMRAADFTDVAAGYWGYSYIDFSAGKGIINGYPLFDGTYRFMPENSVTDEEAVTMLYRMLSALGKLKSTEDFTAEYSNIFAEHKISPWAQKFVAYGLKYQLIAETDLKDFINEKGTGSAASREKVARWTANAVGSGLAPAFSLIYADKDSISAQNIPYIDLLYRQGIMQGDDRKMFRPASGIKRAEFAAICKRVFELETAGVYSEDREVLSCRGTIVSVDTYNNRIMMTQSDGAAKVIQVNPKSQIVIDGKVNYNGLGGITAGTAAVVAWGAFYYPDQNDSEKNILQLHIISKNQTRQGLISGIEKLDEQTSLLKIENENGDAIYYILDKNSQTEKTLQKGTTVTFIADGIKILEMK